MSTPSLVLWLQLEPLTWLFGFLLGLATYLAACPRRRETWQELGSVGWQVLALAATAPSFLLGAELSLWLGLMGLRAPLALTGLVRGLGWTLLALGPIPVVAALVYGRRPTGRWAIGTLTLLTVGYALTIAGPRWRDAAWTDLAARAAADPEALDRALVLEAHRYTSPAEREALLDAAAPDPAAARALAERARTTGRPYLSLAAKASLAERILAGLTLDADAAGGPAAPDLWWLTADPAATLRGHALATPALRAAALEASPRLPRAFQPIAADALDHGDAATRQAAAAATFLAAAPVLLEPALINALSRRLDEPDPAGRLIWETLLRNASAASLRPIVPAYADPSARQWLWLRDLCPTRTPDLIALQDDPDPAVAEGARKLFAYVKLNCKAAYRQR
ncbi:MAG: hypothetical protein IT332_09815 [Ardenticatenales bacterium]|nr:hypothetical protein [Ardenticatenales bacterium]